MNGLKVPSPVEGATGSDLALLAPELILVGTGLALILAARRIGKTDAAWAIMITVLAALAAGVASVWALPWDAQTGFGGLIVQDGYARFFKVLIVAALGLAALLSTRGSDTGPVPRAEYHALLLLASTGMMLAVSSLDLVTLYLSLELATICSYILVGLSVEAPRSNEAAVKYFLIASFASALLLYGISLTYGLTGTTDLSAVARSLAGRDPGDTPLLLMALGLLAAGLAFKIAAVPFHAWAPDAYQGASAPVAAFLAAGSKAAGLAVLGRVCWVAFGSQTQILSPVLAVLALLSMILGCTVLLAQTDMKRLLAYSSIAHVGYALLGLAAGTSEGVSATMTYAFFYVFMTLGAFGGVVALGKRGESLDGFRGLAGERPGLAALMLLFLLSLAGIPPTAGFVAKFVVIASAVKAGYVPLAVLAVATSVATAFVYMRVALLMYMEESRDPAPAPLPATLGVALALAAGVTLAGGILPGSLARWAVSP